MAEEKEEKQVNVINGTALSFLDIYGHQHVLSSAKALLCLRNCVRSSLRSDSGFSVDTVEDEETQRENPNGFQPPMYSQREVDNLIEFALAEASEGTRAVDPIPFDLRGIDERFREEVRVEDGGGKRKKKSRRRKSRRKNRKRRGTRKRRRTRKRCSGRR